MKDIILLVALAVVATTAKQSILTDDARTRINKIEKRCKRVGNYSIEETMCSILADDDNERNYFRCVFTGMNWINEDSFNADRFKKDINKDSPPNVIDSCNNLQSSGSHLIDSICNCISTVTVTTVSYDNPDY